MNNTHHHSRPQYENDSIPVWGFNSSCDWLTAVRVDLTVSAVATFYNLIIAFLPLLVSRMYCMQGAVISSYTLSASVVSLYSAFFDSRLLASGKQQLEDEGCVLYLLIWFLSYHCMFHMHLLSWDQHHAITRFNAHRRFASRSKLIQIELVVWVSAIAFTLLEAFFIHNPLNYDRKMVTQHVSFFRLIIILISMGFSWFGPLILIVSWNAMVFTFLLKVIHNGYEKQQPPEDTERNNGEVLREIDPWNRVRDDEMYYEDPPEHATLPDDVTFQLTQSFANFLTVTTFATIMIIWSSYHVLAIFRIGDVLRHYQFYEIIYNCELYISLYAVTKFMLLLNPLWFFYYRKEMRMCTAVRMRYGVTHE